MFLTDDRIRFDAHDMKQVVTLGMSPALEELGATLKRSTESGMLLVPREADFCCQLMPSLASLSDDNLSISRFSSSCLMAQFMH